jgi:2-polyprenyl-3-methyl-5-hydroxy-6-metoxy-1,4-benzoquinol methylase
MICKICRSTTRDLFQATCLKKYSVTYYHCDKCGFLQAEDPCWLQEAYEDPINETDTGLLSRNIYLSNVTTTLLFSLFARKGIFLDYAGGYGILTRMMRDYGFDYYWHDIYTKNIFAKGFEYNENIKRVDLVTCFEAFEHFVHPIQEIDKILRISDNILFSTELLPSPVPRPQQWWYYGLEHGQHVSFYSVKTLNHLANKYALNFYTDNRFVHIFTKKKINETTYKFLVRMSSYGLGHVIKLFLQSRTFADMERLKSSKSKREP